MITNGCYTVSHDDVHEYESEPIVVLKNRNIRSLRFAPKLHVVTLNLSNVAITCLRVLENVPSIEHLVVSHNKLTSLRSLPAMPRLRSLDVLYNAIGSFEGFRTIDTLESLTCCYLSMTSFQHLPAMPALTKFIFMDSEIGTFEHFPRFPMLQTLVISVCCNIESFKFLPHVDTLMEFHMYDSAVSSFDDFPEFPRLEVLCVDDAMITEYTHVFATLKVLTLHSNALRKIPDVTTMPLLRELGILNNPISDDMPENFPIILDKFEGLGEFFSNIWDRYRLRVVDIAIVFGRLPNIVIFEIVNMLVDRSPEWRYYDRMTIINTVCDAKIDLFFHLTTTRIHMDSQLLVSLEYKDETIDLTFSEITRLRIDRRFTDLSFVRKLDITGNSIRCLCAIASMTHLEQLYASDNKIASMSAFDDMPTLLTLDISDNLFADFTDFPSMPSLVSLTCGSINLESLVGLPVLDNLTELNISMGSFETLEGLPRLPALKTLVLNECMGLQSLDCVDAPNLQQLDIGCCSGIDQIDESLFTQLVVLRANEVSLDKMIDLSLLPRLRVLDVCGWCNCNDQDLSQLDEFYCNCDRCFSVNWRAYRSHIIDIVMVLWKLPDVAIMSVLDSMTYRPLQWRYYDRMQVIGDVKTSIGKWKTSI